MAKSKLCAVALVLICALTIVAGCSPAQTGAPAPKAGAPASQAPAASPVAPAAPVAPAPAPKAAPVERTALKFRTSFPPSMANASIYSARKLHWPGLGLDVTVLPGKGSPEAVQTVGAGSEQVGFASVQAILAGIQAGAPVRLVSVIQRRDPTGVIFPVSAPLQSLQDLVGKTVSAFPTGQVGPILRATLKKEGIDADKVRIVNVRAGGEMQLLLQKKVDAIMGIARGQDVKLGCQGFKAASIPMARYGMEFYGQGVFVNTAWEQKVGPEVVARLLLGTTQGAVSSKQDPEQAIKALQEATPDTPVERADQLTTLAGRLQYEQSTESAPFLKHGFGWIDAGEMARSQDVLVNVGLLQEKGDPQKYYTTRYLEDPRVQKAAQQWLSVPWPPVPADVRQACGL